MSIVAVKAYSCTLVSDGESTSFSLDLSLLPFFENFVGRQPSGVLFPNIASVYTGNVAGVTVELVGTTVTFTIPAADDMPHEDNASNVIVYTVTFSLTF